MQIDHVTRGKPRPLPWPIAVAFLALVSLGVTSVLGYAGLPQRQFGLLVFLSGPTILYFLAGHGGSYLFWAFGVTLVCAPLVVCRLRGVLGALPYAGCLAVWLSLCLAFGWPFLMTAFANEA